MFVPSFAASQIASSSLAAHLQRSLATLLTCAVAAWPIVCIAAPPAVLFTDIEVGPKVGGPGNFGTPISIFGSRFGAAKGASKVTIGGVEVASYLVWGEHNATNPYLDMIVVQPGSGVAGGPIVVTVDGEASNADFTFTPNAGTIFYVSPTGSDANPGTEAQPFKTISHAMTGGLSQPGDVVLCRGGVYDEGEVWIRGEYGHGGTAAQPKSIRNYPGEFVELNNPERPFILQAEYVCVSGLHFRNNKGFGIPDGIVAADLQDHDKIINCSSIGPIDYDGMGTHGSYHVIAGNWIEVQGSSQGTQGHCLYVSVGSHNKILYNILRGAPGYGLHLFDQWRGNATNPDYQRVISDVLVEGNVMTDSVERSGMIIAMGDENKLGNRIENILIRNNIFARNSHLGVLVKSIASDIRVVNNTFYENGRQDAHVTVEGGTLDDVEIRNNLFHHTVGNGYCNDNCQWYNDAHVQVGALPTNVVVAHNGYFSAGGGPPLLIGTSDPSPVTGAVAFVNSVGLDLRLVSGSSAIDAGLFNTEVIKDMLGIARPQGAAYDLGAHEFDSDAPGCAADCDGNGLLSIDDFICFQTLFAVGDPKADCDGSGSLNIDDFVCFQTLFAVGC